MSNANQTDPDRESDAIQDVRQLLQSRTDEAVIRKRLETFYPELDPDFVLGMAQSGFDSFVAGTAAFRAAGRATRRDAAKQAKQDALEAQVEAVDTEPKNRPATDLGNAERFFDLHLGNVYFDRGLGGWRVYDGKRWVPDESAAFLLAIDAARGIAREAAELYQNGRDEAAQKRATSLFAWAMRSESRERLKAMLDIARHFPAMAMPASAFDADPWLFNVANGTINLKTGELRPHNPGDFITKISPVPFIRGLRDARWEQFLREAFDGDEASIRFAQRAFGYALTGSTVEEKLFFLLGLAGTGKSTLIDAGRAAAGDYAVVAEFETFLRKPGSGGARHDVADLAGARMVVAAEPDDGRTLSDGLIKSLTGGDAITARHLYKENFTFKPQFKLFLVANSSPRMSDSDTGLWRRVLRIPFENVPTRPDPTLKVWLQNPEGGARAVLSWAVEGCLAWQREGLGVSERITAATADLRLSFDPLADFFKERCIFEPGVWISASQLRRAYEGWARDRGTRDSFLVSPNRFADRLKSAGCSNRRTMNGKIWDGIRLQDDLDGTPCRPMTTYEPSSVNSSQEEKYRKSYEGGVHSVHGRSYPTKTEDGWTPTPPPDLEEIEQVFFDSAGAE
jgi:putative DNA primase/helicase